MDDRSPWIRRSGSGINPDPQHSDSVGRALAFGMSPEITKRCAVCGPFRPYHADDRYCIVCGHPYEFAAADHLGNLIIEAAA